MAELLGDDLQYYEDPTPGLEGMAELHRRTGLPLATNMVVTDFDEFRRSVALNSVQIVLADHHYRSEEHTSELQSLMRISYAVFWLKKKKKKVTYQNNI